MLYALCVRSTQYTAAGRQAEWIWKLDRRRANVLWSFQIEQFVRVRLQRFQGCLGAATIAFLVPMSSDPPPSLYVSARSPSLPYTKYLHTKYLGRLLRTWYLSTQSTINCLLRRQSQPCSEQVHNCGHDPVDGKRKSLVGSVHRPWTAVHTWQSTTVPVLLHSPCLQVAEVRPSKSPADKLGEKEVIVGLPFSRYGVPSVKRTMAHYCYLLRLCTCQYSTTVDLPTMTCQIAKPTHQRPK